MRSLVPLLVALAALTSAGEALAAGNVLSCSAKGPDTTSATTGAFTPARSCQLTVPESGRLLVVGGGQFTSSGTGYAAFLAVRVGAGRTTFQRVAVGLNGMPSTRATSLPYMVDVTPGTYTVETAVGREAGTEAATLTAASVWAVFLPDGSPYQTCFAPLNGGSAGSYLKTTAPAADVMGCSLDVRRPSTAFVLSSVSAASDEAGSEHTYQLVADGTAVPGTERRVDTTESRLAPVLTSFVADVAPGPHDFRLVGRRSRGVGGAYPADLHFMVLVVPTASTPADRLRLCGEQDGTTFTTTSGNVTDAATCDLEAPRAGRALLTASASPNLLSNAASAEYLARFIPQEGSMQTDASFPRFAKPFADAGDGHDPGLGLSIGFDVGAGPRRFRLLGNRSGGTGTVVARNPALTALVVPDPDATAPTVTVTGQPPQTTAETGAAVSWVTDEPTVDSCSLDGAAFVPCSSPAPFGGLAPGPHTVAIRSNDGVDNIGTASASWTVVAPPAVAPPGSDAPKAPPAASGPPSESRPSNPPLLVCAGRELQLTSVVEQSGRLRFAGVATVGQVGKRVVIRAGAQRVASVVVGADQRFTVAVAASRALRKAAFTAAIGSARSRAARRVPGLQLQQPRAVAGGVLVRGRLTGRRAGGRSIKVTQQTTCGASRAVTTARTSKDGRFVVRLPKPPRTIVYTLALPGGRALPVAVGAP